MTDSLFSYPVKLVKYIASCGIASRRNSFDMIRDGRVSVNDTIIVEPSYMVQESDSVSVNGKKVSLQSYVYIMLNKPRGYACTSSDPYADKKAIDLIKCSSRIFNVGRLDKDSEGLIIFTNDGDYANKLIHPSNSILKRYEVTTSSPIPKPKLDELIRGIKDEGEILKALSINEIAHNKYLFTLGEGKKREIRRMVTYAGEKVIKLVRISIGSLQLNSLKIGQWRHMTEKEIKQSLDNGG